MRLSAFQKLSPHDIRRCQEIACREGPDAADHEAERLAALREAPASMGDVEELRRRIEALEPKAETVRWPVF